MRQPIVPRLAGVVVGVAMVAVAIQWLLVSFDAAPLLRPRHTVEVADWIRTVPSSGLGFLSGLALALLGVVLAWTTVRSFGRDRGVLKVRSEAGVTRLDRASLGASLSRRLALVDRRVDVDAEVQRNGRVDLAVTVPGDASAGPAHELRQELDSICSQRHIPCRPGKVQIRPARRETGRRRVR